MSDDEIKEMILEIIKNVDYDIYKDLVDNEWGNADEELEPLITIAKKYIK